MNFKEFRKNKVVIGLLVLILLYGLVLRVYGLGVPPLWFDETISSLAANEIAEKGIPLFDSGLFYSRALVFHYIQGLFIFLFGATDTIVRLVSVLFGLGTIVLAFFIGREFNKPAGVIASLLTAVMFFEVLYSRQARFYQLFQFLFFLTLFFLYKSKKSKRYAILASISLILLVQTQVAGLVLAPFFLFIFYKEHKDWKLYVIPLLVGLYFGLSFLQVEIGTSLGSSYAEQYTSKIFNGLRAFFVISLIGMPFAYKMNKRMFYLLLLPSLLMFIGLFFIKVFALRYSYFLVFSVIIFTAVLFSYVLKNNKILGIALILAAIIYPSNLFFSSNYLTVIEPQVMRPYGITEPVIDYKSLNESTKEFIQESTIITLSTPGVEWYLKKPDYIIPFSLNGLESGYAIYENKDVYTGAQIWDNQVESFVLLEDLFGYSKIGPTKIAQLNIMKEKCLLLEQSTTLRVYSCA